MNTRHSWTFYVILLHILIIPLVPWKTYVGPIPLSAEVVLIPLLVLTFLYEWRNGRLTLNRNIPYKTFGVLFALYFVIQAISLTQAIVILPSLMEMARFLSYVFLFLITLLVVFSKREYKLLGLMFAGVITVIAIYGILQFVLDWNLNKAGIYALNEAHGRVQALTMNPNYWASFINMLIPAAVLFAVVWFNDKRYQLITLLLFSLLVINQMFTYTRSAWVIMTLAIVMTACFIPKRFFKQIIRPHLLMAVLVLVVVVFSLPDVQDRAKSSLFVIESFLPEGYLDDAETGEGDGQTEADERNESFSNHAAASRTTLWKTGLTMYQENPILGVGKGNYSENYSDIVTRHEELYIGHDDSYSVHNSYLKVMAETGTIGIMAFMAIYLYYYSFIIKLYFATNQILVNKILLIALFIGSGTFMGQNLSNNLVFIPQINILFWLGSALVMAYVVNDRNKSQEKTTN